MNEPAARGMAGIGAAVAMASVASPRRFLRLFGIPGHEVSGAAALGWRLFAVRTAYISRLALGGNETARAAFLPIQVLDQAVFLHAFATRSVPRRASLMAAAASGAIIALEAARRRSAREEGSH